MPQTHRSRRLLPSADHQNVVILEILGPEDLFIQCLIGGVEIDDLDNFDVEYLPLERSNNQIGVKLFDR
jgi:hypothetical protein